MKRLRTASLVPLLLAGAALSALLAVGSMNLPIAAQQKDGKAEPKKAEPKAGEKKPESKPVEKPAESKPVSPSLTRPELGYDSPNFAKLRADPKDKPFSFLLMGDQHFNGQGDSVKFMQLFVKKLPELPDHDFIITLGDQINTGGNYRDWLEYGGNTFSRAWIDEMLKRGTAIFPLAGNHEVGTRTVSNAERAIISEDKEMERLIAAAGKDPQLLAARLAVYRGIREDLKKGLLGENRPEWGRFFEINFYEDLFRKNADRVKHAPNVKTPDELWYSLRHGGCLFLFVDGNLNTRTSFAKAVERDSMGLRQFRWLEAELAAAERDGTRHVFVLVHQPLWVSDNVHEADTRDMRTVRYPAGRDLSAEEIAALDKQAKDDAVKAKKDVKTLPAVRTRELVHFAELFRRYKVTAVFSGHIHRYERYMWDQGNGRRVPCLTTGGSGTSRGKSAINTDAEILTVDHVERSARGTNPRVDILSTARGQRVHQMYPQTSVQQAQPADKKFFVVRITVDGPRVGLETLPLEELKRDGKVVKNYESVPDLLTEDPPKPQPPTRTNFRRHVIADGGYPAAALAADFRGAGRPQVLAVDLASGLWSIDLGVADAPRKWVAAVDGAAAVRAHDLDGNGRPDLFVGRFGRGAQRGAWYWLRNPGPAGGDWESILIDDGPFARGAQAAAFADLNADGKQDLVVGCFHSGAISWYQVPADPTRRSDWQRHNLHVPDGSSSPRSGAAAFGLRALAPAPSRRPDAAMKPPAVPVVAAYAREKESIVLFEPTRPKEDTTDGPIEAEKVGFRRVVIEGGASDPSDILVADVNGDGNNDVVIADRGVSTQNNKGLVAWVRTTNDQNQTVWAKQVIDRTVGMAGSVAAADMDGDGRIDLIVTHRDDKTRVHHVLLFRNKGSGFERRVVGTLGEEGPLAGEAGKLTIVDFNGDGRPDILAAGLVTGRIVWFENLPPGTEGDPE